MTGHTVQVMSIDMELYRATLRRVEESKRDPVGAWMLATRKAAGLSQRVCGSRVQPEGVTDRTWARWEWSGPPPHRLLEITRILDRDLSDVPGYGGTARSRLGPAAEVHQHLDALTAVVEEGFRGLSETLNDVLTALLANDQRLDGIEQDLRAPQAANTRRRHEGGQQRSS